MVLAARHAVAALLLVAFVLASDAAALRPTVSDILQGVKPSNQPKASSPQASVAASQENNQESYGGDNHYTGSDYAHSVETKDVCIVEVQRSQCLEYGDHYDWKSDYALCQTAKNYYSSNSGVGFGAVGTTPPLTAIGSCDWHFDEGFFTYFTENIEYMGRVYGTCFWNGNGEDCDGPLCHRMVFGLQGSYYYVDYAFSYSGGAAENYNSDAWPDCTLGVFRQGREARSRAADNSTTSTPASGGRGQGRKAPRLPKSAHGQHTRTKAAAIASGSAKYGGQDSVFSTDRPVYVGYAYVINGIIFGLSGQTKEQWQTGGTFEWTMDFDMYDIASDGTYPGISAGFPWVTDKEMKLTFFKAPSYPASYYSA